MTETYEDLNSLDLVQVRERVLQLQNRLLQRSMGEAFYADVCRMEDEIKRLRRELARAEADRDAARVWLRRARATFAEVRAILNLPNEAKLTDACRTWRAMYEGLRTKLIELQGGDR